MSCIWPVSLYPLTAVDPLLLSVVWYSEDGPKLLVRVSSHRPTSHLIAPDSLLPGVAASMGRTRTRTPRWAFRAPSLMLGYRTCCAPPRPSFVLPMYHPLAESAILISCFWQWPWCYELGFPVYALSGRGTVVGRQFTLIFICKTR